MIMIGKTIKVSWMRSDEFETKSILKLKRFFIKLAQTWHRLPEIKKGL
jgi:hypothetical protein